MIDMIFFNNIKIPHRDMKEKRLLFMLCSKFSYMIRVSTSGK